MVTTSVQASTDTTAAAAAMKESLGMNKDDFLNMFVAQLKYQDPLNPQDASAMLDTLTQLTLVEQSYNNNTALNDLLTAQNNATALSTVSFIGKDVKANGNAISFDGATAVNLQFNETTATASNDIVIQNDAGTVVRTIKTGALASGDNSVAWDGCDDNGVLLAAGAYSFTVTGTSTTGSATTATTYTSGKVTGISFASGDPVLTIGSITIPFSDVISAGG